MSTVMNEPDKYGLNLQEFYINAYECATQGDGQVSSSYGDWPTDGSVPQCFFNMGVVEGVLSLDSTGQVEILDPVVMTAGADDSVVEIEPGSG